MCAMWLDGEGGMCQKYTIGFLRLHQKWLRAFFVLRLR